MTIHLTAADYGSVLPEIIVVCGALALLLIDAMVSPVPQPVPQAAVGKDTRVSGLEARKMAITAGTSLGTLALALIASIHLWLVNAGPAFPASFPMVTGDRFAQFFDFVLIAAAALAILIAPTHLRFSHFDSGEFFALVLFSLSGMMLLAAGLNLMVLFLAIELLSLALYILSGFDRSRPRSQEAGFKYFLLSSFASAFLIYGMALIYGATGSTNLTTIGRVIAGWLHGNAAGTVVPAHALGGPFLIAGIGLMAVGFAFKLSVVPFHMWTPDVYEGAPTPITAFMSVATKVAAFAAVARVFDVALGGIPDRWFPVLWALAVATMVVGNVLALVQSNMKRLLAYSGIAHAGYALVAVAVARHLSASSGSRFGFSALAFYLFVYAFMNIGAFVLVAVMENRDEVGDRIDSYRGLLARNPALAVATAIFMFSLAGFPPTAGFFAKYYVFLSAVRAGHTELAIIGVITSVVSLGYYLRVIMLIFMQPAEEGAPAVKIGLMPGLAIAACVAGTLLMGVIPWFFNLAAAAAHSIA
jgi:NADH-quinone oxidoreductase subunit N